MDYINNQGIFYIHLNKIHIGKRCPIAINFNQKKKDMGVLLQQNYNEQFLKNIKMPPNTLKSLNAAMGISEQEFIQTLDRQIKNSLQEELATDKLQKLFDTVKPQNKPSLNKLAEQLVSDKSMSTLNEILEILKESVELLNGGKKLGVAILAAKKAGNISDAGAILEAQLKNWTVSNNMKTIDKQAIQASVNQLRNFAFVLQANADGNHYFKSGNLMTAKGLKTLLSNNLISTSIAENLAFSMKTTATSLLYKTIVQNIGSKGQFIPDPNQISKTWMPSGKTDIKLSNVKLNIAGIGQEIKLDIGISSKFYTNKDSKFLGNLSDSSLTGSISSGSGGRLQDAINAIFSNSAEKYLVYNYFAHEKYQKELNDLILTRQLLRLFSASGIAKDFSQYMLINGKIFSIGEIVNYAINSSLGLSQSLKGDTSQGLVLHIEGRENFKKKNFVKAENGKTIEEAAWERAHNKNDEINRAKITAKLHIANLVKAMPK